ncbi:MAG: glycosyltransferase family 39 protein [Candidatus Binatia bacterium]
MVKPSSTLSFWIGLALVSAIGVVLTAYHAIKFGIPFADTAIYVEVGRNLLAGRGFITRFNMVQGWSGALSYPGLAYYCPLYGLVLGAVWWLVGDPGYVGVLATALPCCIDAALLALLVRSTMGPVAALLSAIGYLLIPTTWISITLIGIEHPAVGIVLLCLLIVQYRVPHDANSWLWVGVLLGLGVLVKVSIALAWPGFIVAIGLTQNSSVKQRLRAGVLPVALLLAGIALVLVPYEALCRLVVGDLYPSYAPTGQNWGLATTFGGHFVAASPAVQPDLARLPSSSEKLANMAANMWSMLRWSTGELGLLTLTAVVVFVRGSDAARRLATFLVCIGAFYAAGHGASGNWFRFASDPSIAARYAIYTVAFWYPVGVYGLILLGEWLITSVTVRGAVVVAVWALVSIPIAVPLFKQFQTDARLEQHRVTRVQQVMQHCATLVGEDDLVAIAGGGMLIAGAVFLDRPAVALPQGAMDTPLTMREFIDVYHPALVIPGNNRSSYEVLPQMGYQLRRIKELGGTPVFLRAAQHA